VPKKQKHSEFNKQEIIEFWHGSGIGQLDNNDNNNDRLTAFDPGQPG